MAEAWAEAKTWAETKTWAGAGDEAWVWAGRPEASWELLLFSLPGKALLSSATLAINSTAHGTALNQGLSNRFLSSAAITCSILMSVLQSRSPAIYPQCPKTVSCSLLGQFQVPSFCHARVLRGKLRKWEVDPNAVLTGQEAGNGEKQKAGFYWKQRLNATKKTKSMTRNISPGTRKQNSNKISKTKYNQKAKFKSNNAQCKTQNIPKWETVDKTQGSWTRHHTDSSRNRGRDREWRGNKDLHIETHWWGDEEQVRRERREEARCGNDGGKHRGEKTDRQRQTATREIYRRTWRTQAGMGNQNIRHNKTQHKGMEIKYKKPQNTESWTMTSENLHLHSSYCMFMYSVFIPVFPTHLFLAVCHNINIGCHILSFFLWNCALHSHSLWTLWKTHLLNIIQSSQPLWNYSFTVRIWAIQSNKIWRVYKSHLITFRLHPS